MNYRELDELVVQLKKIFDVVRLVDVDKTEVVMPEQSHACYAVWNRQERCENCISARVVAQNLGFGPLYKAAAEVTESLRPSETSSGDMEKAAKLMPAVDEEYARTIAAIKEL